MKKKLISIALLPVFIAFAGCGQQEEPAAETAQAEAVKATETASAETETVQTETGQTANSLVAATDALKKSVPDLETQAKMEEKTAEMEETVTKEVAAMETQTQAPETQAVEAEGDSLMTKALGTAGSLASGLDLSNLSWDKVSEVPYSDKAALVAWATQQASTWKSKLTDAAMQQGTSMLNNLGDTGWQGALKKVMDALDGVREASPETWEMARGALVSAWDNFETQASAFLEKE
jgi:hypothetical protein